MNVDRRIAVGPIVVATVILVSALSNLPSRIAIGSLSLQGLWTASVGFGVWPVLLITYRRIPRRFLFFGCTGVAFILWAVTTLTLARGRSGLAMSAIQNLSVYSGFVGVTLLSGRIVVTRPAWCGLLGKLTIGAIAILALGYLSQVAIVGVGSKVPLGAASCSALFVVGVAVVLGRWHQSRSLVANGVLGIVLTLGAFLALSREALAAILAMLCIWVILRKGGIRRLVRAGVAILFGGVLIYLSFEYRPLQRAMFRGDRAYSVLGVTINTSGRMGLYQTLLPGIADEPVIGHGAGAAALEVARRVKTVVQPHNDYLRLLYDTGSVGLILWIVMYVGTWWTLARWYVRRGREMEAQMQPLGGDWLLVACCAVVGVGVLALFDNVFVYPHIMFPLGVLTGLGMGTMVHEERVEEVRAYRCASHYEVIEGFESNTFGSLGLA